MINVLLIYKAFFAIIDGKKENTFLVKMCPRGIGIMPG